MNSEALGTEIGAEVENLDLTLLANFVHQVVNPMNGVAGTLDNLIDGTIKENRREQRTNSARAQLERCISLVRNLAFLVGDPKVLEGVDLKTVVLPQVIIESAMFFQEEGKTKRIEIFLEDKRTQNCVSGHPELIRQVLMNIFDNGVKYSRVGSKIVVNQWLQSGTNFAVITIRNEPEVNVDPSDLEHIFELGFRGANAKAVVASGTGIGLYVCKQLIEVKHGGTLSCQRDGSGLLFTIKLPRGVRH